MNVYYEQLLTLSVYRGIVARPIGRTLKEAVRLLDSEDREAKLSAFGELAAQLCSHQKPDRLLTALANELLSDENAFTRAAAAEQARPALLEEATRHDLGAWYAAALAVCEASAADPALPRLVTGSIAAPFDAPWGEQVDALAAWHAHHGCGEFVFHTAFLWRNGRMKPVEHTDPIRLSDLKGYESQHNTACDNTVAFLHGLPANNILLYGDRGTGKSSTVKALLNEYADAGLRMIEVPKEYLRELPDLTDRLALLPMKFIVFIDDLSFSDDDDNFSALKAVLEGGLATRPSNVLIYATSNRRHLLRERFDDRAGDEVHAADTVQEAVSLSDRFGITLTFIHPDQARFVAMIREIGADMGLLLDDAQLYDIAQRLQSSRGARSPRFARQYLIELKQQQAR